MGFGWGETDILQATISGVNLGGEELTEMIVDVGIGQNDGMTMTKGNGRTRFIVDCHGIGVSRGTIRVEETKGLMKAVDGMNIIRDFIPKMDDGRFGWGHDSSSSSCRILS